MNLLESIASTYSPTSKESFLSLDNDGNFKWTQKKQDVQNAINKISGEIGAERFERICQRQSISKKQLCYLSERVVEKIFIGIGDVRKEDLSEISGGNIPANSTEVDLLFNRLLFNLKPKQIFFRDKPDLLQGVDKRDADRTSGRGFKGLRDRTWVILKYRQRCLKHPENHFKAQIEDTEFSVSRLMDREPPEGTMIRLHKGYFFNDRTFSQKGGYVAVFKNVDPQKPALVNCRGTRMPFMASTGTASVLNDLLVQIGSLAARKTWGPFQSYLDASDIKQVEITGKSMGGALAQYLTVLIHGKTECRVKKLTTYCSTGVPKSLQKIYDDTVINTKKKPKIRVIRNTGRLEDKLVDLIPSVGGPHLRNKGDKENRNKVFYVAPPGENVHENYPKEISLFSKFKHFLKSFSNGHINQTTLTKDYKIYVVKDEDKEQELNVGEDLEKIRRVAAWIFTIFTFGIFQQKFENFYANLN